ncbi:MAG: transporter substrate-binding domain-containing protein [Bacilli bacterium]
MKKNLLGLTLSLCILAVSGMSSCTQTNENTIIIGLECNYAPFNWTTPTSSEHTLPIANSAGNYADGYDINFAKKLSSALNVEVQVMKLEWTSLISNLNTNVIDCIIAGMTDNEERRQSISFSEEYYRSELVLVVKKDIADSHQNIMEATDLSTLLNGKYIESQMSTVTDDVIDTLSTNYGANHSTPVDSFAHAANDVKQGLVFAMTAEYPVAQSIVNSNTDLGIIRMNQEILGVDLSSLGVSIGVRKDDTELQTKLNSVLADYSSEDRFADMTAAISRSGE